MDAQEDGRLDDSDEDWLPPPALHRLLTDSWRGRNPDRELFALPRLKLLLVVESDSPLLRLLSIDRVGSDSPLLTLDRATPMVVGSEFLLAEDRGVLVVSALSLLPMARVNAGSESPLCRMNRACSDVGDSGRHTPE